MPRPEQDTRREEAFDLFRSGTPLRRIARTLGVTLSTVQWWRKADNWDERAAAQMPTDVAAIRDLLRSGFYEGLQELERLLLTTKDAGVRIKIALALGKLCKDFGIRPQHATPTTPVTLEFKDDLPVREAIP